MTPLARPPRRTVLAAALIAPFAAAVPAAALADDRSHIDADANRMLMRLYRQQPQMRRLGARSVAILIFPKITKAGFIVGGMGGQGVLRVHNRSVGYYSISGGSFGLQAGAKTFAYALFFMHPSALDYLRNQKGFTIGAGPSVVVADQAASKHLDTATGTNDIVAVPFSESGLMAGVSIQGSKIAPINPS